MAIRLDSYVARKIGRLVARSRKVEPEAALHAALVLFWKHGYNALGTRQLEEETGLTRFTLQTSYGGKKSLYLQTLDTYCDQFETLVLPQVSAQGIAGLAEWFEYRARSKTMPDVGCYGCLMLNATIEFQGQDAEVNIRTERYFAGFRDSFTAILRAAKQAGNLVPDFDVAKNVEVLLGVALGMNVLIRAGADNTAAAPMAAAIANQIRGWKTPRI